MASTNPPKSSAFPSATGAEQLKPPKSLPPPLDSSIFNKSGCGFKFPFTDLELELGNFSFAESRVREFLLRGKFSRGIGELQLVS